MTNTLLNFFNLFPTPEPAIENRPPETSTQALELDAYFENQIFDVVNRHRTSLRLPPLRLVSEISDIAREHSRWLSETNFWEGKIGHSGFPNRAKQVKRIMRFESVSENLGTAQVAASRYQTDQGQKTTAEVFLAHWIASTKGHREAIEEYGSTHTGIGVFSCPAHDEDGDTGFIIYVTQLFGG